MFILIILFMLTLAVLSAFYYNKMLWRALSIWSDRKGRKSKIAVWILSSILAVMSFNLFSVIGIFLLHFLVFSLIVDFVALFIKNKNQIFKSIINFGVIPLLISSLIFGHGYANARNIIRTEYNIKSAELEENYKILFVSDTHYGTILDSASLKELKKRLDRENADIVILGGDITDESTTNSEMKEVIKALGSIPSKYGIFYVSGNHDFQTYSQNKDYTEDEFINALKENGIFFLKDETTEVNGEMIIAGRGDKSPERMSVEKLLKKADKNKYIITLDHQPVEYSEAEKCGTDLIVSGHTHAGQVFPAGYMIKLMKTADLWYGHEKVGNMDAVVSSGVAGWGFPIRTQKNSEYVIINIKGVRK